MRAGHGLSTVAGRTPALFCKILSAVSCHCNGNIAGSQYYGLYNSIYNHIFAGHFACYPSLGVISHLFLA